MSLLSGALPQLAALIAQPAVLAAGLATGVAVGAVGVGTGAIPVTDGAPRNAPLYECPGSDRIVTSIAPNQSVLVTARTADGQWLQIYIGEAGAERGWAPAGALQLKAAPDSLPVADCTPDATTEPFPTLGPPSVAPSAEVPSGAPSAGAPSGAPSEAASVPATVNPTGASTPTPSPTNTPTSTPTPTPTPTPGPTPPGPYFSDFTLYDPPKDAGTGTYIIYPPGCTGYFTHAGLTITVTDPDGIGAVYLYFRPYGGDWASIEMLWEGGNLYDGQFGSNGTWGPGPVDYYVLAYDSTEDSATFDPGSAYTVTLEYCAD